MAKGKTSILGCRADGAGSGLSETVVCPVLFLAIRAGLHCELKLAAWNRGLSPCYSLQF